jgi:hypothetical protein
MTLHSEGSEEIMVANLFFLSYKTVKNINCFIGCTSGGGGGGESVGGKSSVK